MSLVVAQSPQTVEPEHEFFLEKDDIFDDGIEPGVLVNDGGDYKVIKLNLLAIPRNSTPICDLTGARGMYELKTNGCSLFYASADLAEQAWSSVLHKIAPLLRRVMHPPALVGTADERQSFATKLKQLKLKLAIFCHDEARTHLYANRPALVIPAAIQALKLWRDVEGNKAVSLVDAHVLLAYAYLKLDEKLKAEEYVAYARWIVTNSEDVSSEKKAKVHLLAGRVASANKQYVQARTEYSKAIYHTSVHTNPVSLECGEGYFHLGEAFLLDEQRENGLAFFDIVVESWLKYLSSFIANNQSQDLASTDLPSFALTEGIGNLTKLLEHRETVLGVDHAATGEAKYVLGLVHYLLLGEAVQAENLILQAAQIYQSHGKEALEQLYNAVNFLKVIQRETNSDLTAIFANLPVPSDDTTNNNENGDDSNNDNKGNDNGGKKGSEEVTSEPSSSLVQGKHVSQGNGTEKRYSEKLLETTKELVELVLDECLLELQMDAEEEAAIVAADAAKERETREREEKELLEEDPVVAVDVAAVGEDGVATDEDVVLDTNNQMLEEVESALSSNRKNEIVSDKSDDNKGMENNVEENIGNEPLYHDNNVAAENNINDSNDNNENDNSNNDDRIESPLSSGNTEAETEIVNERSNERVQFQILSEKDEPVVVPPVDVDENNNVVAVNEVVEGN